LDPSRATGWAALILCLAKAVTLSSGWACEPAEFPVAIDIGHDRARTGAVSARGVPEFEFNLALAREVLTTLLEAGFSRSFLIGESGAPLELRERSATAGRAGARVLVSIHHDSVQPRYLQTWTFQGRVRDYTTYARGFSLFVSAANEHFDASKDLALRIASELRAAGQRPSRHHAEMIEGEGRQVIDALNGVYRFDELAVLRTAAMPAVLLEAGVIKHRDEELVVASKAFQEEVARSIASALERACIEGPAGQPAVAEEEDRARLSPPPLQAPR
jgi:N-acetylmuramoyl-L-alanine amidase